MRALVLAAGRGTRMQAASGGARLAPEQAAAADAGLKAMVPFAGRPFLDYALHALADAGFDDIAIVIGPAHDRVRDHYGRQHLQRLRLSFLMQQEPRGTADAVLAAESWAGDAPFVTLNADNLYPQTVLDALADGDTPALPGFRRDTLGLPLERIGTFALVEVDARGCLARIREKPGARAFEEAGPGALVSMNIWRFDRRIFEACRDVPRSERGEYEIPQAVGLSASRGVCYGVFDASGPIFDLSRRDDVPEVARALAGADVRL